MKRLRELLFIIIPVIIFIQQNVLFPDFIKDKDGETAFDFAIRGSRIEIIQVLLEGGMEFSIHLAAFLGDLEKVKGFLESGMSPDTKNESGYIPLHYAAMGGHKDIVELLINKGGDIDIKSNIDPNDYYLHFPKKCE